MRFRHRDGTVVHVGYCTNVHPAETLDGVIEQLQTYAASVRERLGLSSMSVGLWLSRTVVDEIMCGGLLALARALRDLGLEVVTLNGFPYGGFHAESVKYAVYEPNWSQTERLEYTLDLARVLAHLLPADAVRGSISTLPLMWRTSFDVGTSLAATQLTDKLNAGLAEIAQRTGREIRVAFEPEPGCVVENVEGAIEHIRGTDRIGICFDTCHSAVQFEDPAEAVERLLDAGLSIVKLQASCAVEAGPGDQDALLPYVESRFLHQVRSRTESTDDLPEALSDMDLRESWRVHYHVPIHAAVPPPLRTTSNHLVQALGVLFAGDIALTDHVEVETYTWTVLPGRSEHDLIDGLAAEMNWIREQLMSIDALSVENAPAPISETR